MDAGHDCATPEKRIGGGVFIHKQQMNVGRYTE
jgi:hypothetical protein